MDFPREVAWGEDGPTIKAKVGGKYYSCDVSQEAAQDLFGSFDNESAMKEAVRANQDVIRRALLAVLEQGEVMPNANGERRVAMTAEILQPFVRS